jgi:hypothetical protein
MLEQPIRFVSGMTRYDQMSAKEKTDGIFDFRYEAMAIRACRANFPASVGMRRKYSLTFAVEVALIVTLVTCRMPSQHHFFLDFIFQ